MRRSESKSRARRFSASLGSLLVVVVLLGACEFSPGETEMRVDAPPRIRFEIDIGVELQDVDVSEWPALSVQISERDAESLGSDPTAPFVYRGDDYAVADADLLAGSFILETPDDQAELPCLEDAVVVTIAGRERNVVLFDEGFCPTGRFIEVIEVDSGPVLEALQARS